MNSFRIGVDGGGTKTDLILLRSEDGSVVARHSAPGASPSLLGDAGARDVVHQALAALCQNAGLESAAIERTLLCMAGSRMFWHDFAQSLQGYGRATAIDDAHPVLRLATGGGPGLAIHAGTGSFVAARDPKGGYHYAGGLGWRLGDPGSAHAIGRAALTTAALEWQGWKTPSALSKAAADHFELRDADTFLRILYSIDDANARISGFAPAVTRLAEAGESTARAALETAFGDLASLAVDVMHTLHLANHRPVRCGLSGPIFQSPAAIDVFTDSLQRCGAAVDIRLVSEPPIEGVRALLMETAP